MAKKKAAAKKAGAKAPSASARKAAAEAQRPLEAAGPGVEHEDHEGGASDSLARKGVRAPLLTAEEREEADEEQESVIRAPSVRDRQAITQAILAEGGARVVRDTVDRKGNTVVAPRGAAQVIAARKGSKIVPVVATRLGQYPADGRLRAPGEAFDYVMSADEEKLPSWMSDPSGGVESRAEFEPTAAFEEANRTTLVEVRGDGSATVRGRSAPRSANRNVAV